jgi:hypothetical protein
MYVPLMFSPLSSAATEPPAGSYSLSDLPAHSRSGPANCLAAGNLLIPKQLALFQKRKVRTTPGRQSHQLDGGDGNPTIPAARCASECEAGVGSSPGTCRIPAVLALKVKVDWQIPRAHRPSGTDAENPLWGKNIANELKLKLGFRHRFTARRDRYVIRSAAMPSGLHHELRLERLQHERRTEPLSAQPAPWHVTNRGTSRRSCRLHPSRRLGSVSFTPS